MRTGIFSYGRFKPKLAAAALMLALPAAVGSASAADAPVLPDDPEAKGLAIAEETDRRNLTLSITKNRGGLPRGKLPLSFQGETQRFHEIERE